jgi:uncharacterized membrane protein YeiH
MTFAFSGMLMAENKDFDPVGWYIVACVTAFGGGTLRDVIMDQHPVYWIVHWEFPIIILALTVVFYFLSRFRIPHAVLIVSDAMGLALFTITTMQSLLTNSIVPIIAIILSVMTASFGGLIRDVLCNELPMIFQKVSFYASVSFFGSVLFWLISLTTLPSSISLIFCSLFIFVFRLLAYKYNWRFS